ncbi:MAG TPA: hypothetical protein VNA14_03995 [Mycobacteriales bacterium]|nr:hypothetical protein [Mycobacteriales bacterium]
MRTPLRRLGLGLLALAAAATPVVLRPAATASPPVTAPRLAFGPGQPADPQRDQSEPNIEIDAEGRIYTCGPTGFTTGADYAQMSTDGGDQFHLLGTPPRGQLADRGGGDCYIATGKEKNAQGTYTVNYVGLADADFTTATSRDYGASFGATPTTCSGVTDRQWTTFIDAETAFLIYNDLAPRNTVVQKSTDGGLTWTGYGPCGDTAKKVAAENPDFPGPIKADVDGAHNTENPGEPHVYFGYNRGNNVYLALSVDSGDTWRQCLIAETENDPSNGFVVVDHDRAGNLYAAWGEKGGEEDAFRVMYSWLPVGKIPACTEETENPGWAPPKQVDAPPVRTIVFPWLVASGVPGAVAVTWYGSAADGVADSDQFKGAWDVYVAQTHDAQAANPVWSQVKATTHPMHYDQICLSGLACVAGGDRSLADFFAMALDPTTGRLIVVYNETAKLPDAVGGPVAIPNVLVQNTGYSNLGKWLTERRPVVRRSSADPEGDALAPYSVSSLTVPTPPPPASRTNQPALDVLSVEVGPQVDLDSGAPVDDGGFTVTMKIKDLGDTALQSAVTSTGAQSLIWAFRWINGYQPAALSVNWHPARGFAGGFDDFSTGSTTCIGTSVEPKCLTYPGATDVPIDVNADAGVIRMSVPRDLLETLGAPDEHGRPTAVSADQPGVSRLYSGTVFTMGNVSVNELQGFLYPVDGTAAFDFTLPGKGREIDKDTDGDDDTGGDDGSGGDDDGGTIPTTGGLGWPLAAATVAAAAAFAVRLRRSES